MVEELFEQIMDLCSSSPQRPKIDGSKPGRRYVFREHEACNERLLRDYLAMQPTFDDVKFRCRFQMRRSLFLHIVERVCSFDPWFMQKHDGFGHLGLSTLQNAPQPFAC